MTFETLLLLVAAIFFLSTFFQKGAEYLAYAQYWKSARDNGMQVPSHHMHYIVELCWRALFLVGIFLRFLIL